MSRIRGIESRIPKDTLQVRNSHYELLKRNVEDQSKSKDDAEKKQIDELLQKLPKLDKIFEVHKKIGEGTFSSVYLGSLRQHADLPNSEKKWFAIKHLVPTAHPARIEHELRCLQDMGGKNHVIGVELCLRHLDTIVFVMPYIPHRKFSEYIMDMDAAELQRYMRALLTALQHVHSFGVIHRDVKPSNFLYDRENQRYLLVDFGLAQRMCLAEDEPPAPPPAHANSVQKRPREQDDSAPDAKRMALDLTVGAKADKQAEPQPASPRISPPQPILMPVTQPRLPVQVSVKEAPPSVVSGRCACACAGRGGVCGPCARRGGARAPRAGTQGFRPPEVLLKVCGQGTGVDMWAAGVVLASALTRRYPFFRAADDVSALAELADLIGTEPLHQAALKMGRRIVSSSVRRGLCLRKLCARLRGGPPPAPSSPCTPAAPCAPAPCAPAPCAPAAPAAPCTPCRYCRLPPARCICRDDNFNPEEVRPGAWVCGFPDSAFALAARLLQAWPARRASATEALQHPFLAHPLPPPPPPHPPR